MKIQRKQALTYGLVIAIFLLISILLYFFNQFETIFYSPSIKSEEWCDNQPCVQIELFSTVFIVVQPSSTFIVYFLGILTVLIGAYLLKVGRKQKFVAWWGIALLLWGLGAIFAGTSYQAFSYEIKCAGRAFCIWTSWWEVMYLIFSVGSVDAMMIAQTNLTPERTHYTVMRLYATINFLVYVLIVVIGSVIPITILISFELMVLFLAPSIMIFILFNLKRRRRLKQPIDLYLLHIWVFLIIIMGTYFLYFMTNVTEILWEHDIWFSANDVLHIGLILWMLYIWFTLNKFKKLNDLEKSQ